MTGTCDGLVFTEGQSDEFTLMHDESRTITGLPAGLGYEVTETADAQFDTRSERATGTVAFSDTPIEAEFTNTRKVGSLTITKTVNGLNKLPGDDGVEFEFDVVLKHGEQGLSGTFGDYTFKNELLADGVPVAATPVWSATDTGEWTYTFRGLPRVNANGEPIQYTIQVQPVDGYDVDVNGTDVTASLIHRDPEAWMQMSGTKTWDDGNDARGLRPEEITLRLLRDGELFESLTVSEVEGWSYSFGELPADDGYGHVYGYELREDGVVGYFARVDGMNVTNSLQLRNTLPLANDGADPTAPEGAAPVEPLGVGYEEDRNTGTSLPKFGDYTEAELEEQYSMFGYDTPKAGMLNTGDETPARPWAFGGAGALALIALALLGRKKKRA